MILLKDWTDDTAKEWAESPASTKDLAAFGRWVVIVHHLNSKSDRIKFV